MNTNEGNSVEAAWIVAVGYHRLRIEIEEAKEILWAELDRDRDDNDSLRTLVVVAVNRLHATKVELQAADAVIAKLKRDNNELSQALRDCVGTYGPADQVVVTAERQEAWLEVLERCGT